MESDLWIVTDKDGYHMSEGAADRAQCERDISYYMDMEYGSKFHIVHAVTEEIVDTYEQCEHFECPDNISCENCLAYPNCPLHKRLSKSK